MAFNFLAMAILMAFSFFGSGRILSLFFFDQALPDGRLRVEEPGGPASSEEISEWRRASTAFLVAANEEEEDKLLKLREAQPKRMERIANAQCDVHNTAKEIVRQMSGKMLCLTPFVLAFTLHAFEFQDAK